MTQGSRMRTRSVMVALLLAMMLFVVVVAPLDAQQGKGKGKGGGKGCEIPEVPITALLPLAAGASVAGYYLVRHYRARGERESRPR